jgi:REP element-mobilizing transposase RayT
MRKTAFTEGEYYHIYNRGTERREIFSDQNDFARFVESLVEFNVREPIGSLLEHTFRKKRRLLGGRTSKEADQPLVNIVAYCLNPNHYHLILEPVAEKGIEKYMQRIGTGYTMYFNNKYQRTGALFQGKFKAIHIDSNAYLLHMSAYVNLNNRVHRLGGSTSKSSWAEYTRMNDRGRGGVQGICTREAILGQFRKNEEYVIFAEDSLRGILERRSPLDESMLLE